VRFEWDETKRVANLRKHGIDFSGVEALFAGPTVTVEDDREEYGERRLLTLGLLEGRVVMVVHAERSAVIRIISIRKALRREQDLFFSTL
jgi:hypothetical protein